MMKTKAPNNDFKKIIADYYSSIDRLEFDMKAKRDRLRLEAYNNPEFDDGSDRNDQFN
jgi:hypothetical protein